MVHRLFQLAFWLAITATLYLALKEVTIHVPASDKTQHAVVFFVLTGLGAVAYSGWRLWAMPFALSAFGGLIEILQPYFGRDRDYRDWIADTIGIAIAVAIVWLATRLGRSGGTRPDRR